MLITVKKVQFIFERKVVKFSNHTAAQEVPICKGLGLGKEKRTY